MDPYMHLLLFLARSSSISSVLFLSMSAITIQVDGASKGVCCSQVFFRRSFEKLEMICTAKHTFFRYLQQIDVKVKSLRFNDDVSAFPVQSSSQEKFQNLAKTDLRVFQLICGFGLESSILRYLFIYGWMVSSGLFSFCHRYRSSQWESLWNCRYSGGILSSIHPSVFYATYLLRVAGEAGAEPC